MQHEAYLLTGLHADAVRTARRAASARRRLGRHGAGDVAVRSAQLRHTLRAVRGARACVTGAALHCKQRAHALSAYCSLCEYDYNFNYTYQTKPLTAKMSFSSHGVASSTDDWHF